MTGYILGIGSNYQAQQHINFVIHQLRTFGQLTLSSVRQTPDRKKLGDDYLNICAVFHPIPPLTFIQLNHIIHQLEASCGRNRNQPQQVSIDIDCLACSQPMLALDTTLLNHLLYYPFFAISNCVNPRKLVTGKPLIFHPTWYFFQQRLPLTYYEIAGLTDLQLL